MEPMLEIVLEMVTLVSSCLVDAGGWNPLLDDGL